VDWLWCIVASVNTQISSILDREGYPLIAAPSSNFFFIAVVNPLAKETSVYQDAAVLAANIVFVIEISWRRIHLL
jgi:ribosome biogenesis protein Tsr3